MVKTSNKYDDSIKIAEEAVREAHTWDTAWQDILLLKTRRTSDQRAKYDYKVALAEAKRLVLTNWYKDFVWESPTIKADENGNPAK